MALLDDFKARFREFDEATVDQLVPVLDGVWPSYYGDEYDADSKEIILNLVAHLLVVETSEGSDPLKGVVSQSVGSVSLSFDQGAQSSGHMSDFFASTKYGKRFLMLTQFRHGGAFV